MRIGVKSPCVVQEEITCTGILHEYSKISPPKARIEHLFDYDNIANYKSKVYSYAAILGIYCKISSKL